MITKANSTNDIKKQPRHQGRIAITTKTWLYGSIPNEPVNLENYTVQIYRIGTTF